MDEADTELLHSCHASAIAAAQPALAMHGPLRATGVHPESCWLISVGKAAAGMALAITQWLGEANRAPAGGVVVMPQADLLAPSGPPPSGFGRVRLVGGDHPIPGAASARAADAVSDLVAQVPPGADVHVAISGGASSLIAGPLPGIGPDELVAAFDQLLGSGLDIHQMNAVRKRLTRWSAGRLGLALVGRTVHVWVISDVPGDDLGSIASGPCTGDRWTTEQVQQILARAGMADRFSPSIRAALERETPKPDDPALVKIHPLIVANNRTALDAAAARAQTSGVRVRMIPERLTGEAAEMGRHVGSVLRDYSTGPRTMLLWGGETTVTLTGPSGVGGRSQELALAAAQYLGESQTPGTLLAAGTDGRDGPTDAAGAIVDRHTWRRIAERGRDPAMDLARHDAYPALDAAGALLRTGPTGTNVMDLAIAVTGGR